MLTDLEKNEIDKEISGCYVRQAGTIEALKAVQKMRGWVSDEAIRDIADYLDVSAEELENVATFYNKIFRKPVGRHLIYVCDGIVCWIMNGETVAQYLYKKLNIGPGETTADGRFTVLPNTCLGACDRAPSAIIDDKLYSYLTTERLDDILEKYE